MRRLALRSRQLLLAGAAALALAGPACGSDPAVDEPAEEGPPADPCSVHLAPAAPGGPADQQAVQTALIEASPGSVICFDDGTYLFTDELSLTVPGVTLRGTDAAAILDFSGQVGGGAGGNGLSVTASDFTIEGLTVKNTPGDAIRVTSADNVTFRKVVVRWDGGASTTNGAYGLYPVSSSHVLIEECVVSGASDAGIYVGQSTDIVVRRSYAFDNVAGIEIENSVGAEVYENEAHDNTGGILVFNLPNLPIKEGRQTLVHDNLVENNNHENFAAAGNIVAAVPVGTGILLMAADELEVRDNTVRGNQAFGVAVTSYLSVDLLRGGTGTVNDPGYDPYPETIWVHDNAVSGNGLAPAGAIAAFAPLADLIWDGYVDPAKTNVDGALSICLPRNGEATFKNLDAPGGFNAPTTDLAPHECDHDPVAPIEL